MNSNQDFHRLIFKPIRTVTIQFLVVILAIVFASPAFAQDRQKNRSGRLSPAKSSSGSPTVGQITTLKPSLSGDAKKRAELEAQIEEKLRAELQMEAEALAAKAAAANAAVPAAAASAPSPVAGCGEVIALHPTRMVKQRKRASGRRFSGPMVGMPLR